VAREAWKPCSSVASFLFAGVLAVLALLVGSTGTASAAACDTSWVGGTGDWTKASNWSNGLPGANGPNVCITASGTYTVNVQARSGDFNNAIASAPNLIVGGASGQQTVAVTGTFTDQTASASLTLGTGTIEANGRIVLDSNDPNHVAGASICAGDPGVVNKGTIAFEAGSGGGRTMLGKVTNEGSFDVNADVEIPGFHSCGSNGLTNKAGGTIDIANGKTLIAKEKFTQSGGTTSVSGAMNLPGTDFTVSGGAFTGNAPVLTSPFTVSPSGGSGTFVVNGGTSFGSDIGPEITIVAEGTATESANLGFRAAANPATNAGTIRLTSTDSGHSASLFAYESVAGSLTNAGTIDVQEGAGGGRSLGLGITNGPTGTISIGADTDGSCCSSGLRLTNEGTLTIAATKKFSLGGAVFVQTGGTTAVNGEMTGAGNALFAVSGGSFTGNPPVLDGKIIAPSGGSGTFVLHGFFNELASGVGSGITLVVEATATDQARLGMRSEANESTNAGTIRITSTSPANPAALYSYDANPDSLKNTGTISVEQGAGGARTLGMAITNAATGKIAIGADTGGYFLRIANSGTLSVAATKTLSSVETLTQSAGTTIVDGNLITGQTATLLGGTLRGIGTVTAPTLNNAGGTVHPGSSPGLLTIAGNYAQAPAGTLAVDVAGTTPGSGYSRLAVTGNASLGGTLDVTNSFVPPVGQALLVLTTGGTRTGTFSSLAVHGDPGYDLQYNPANVTLIAQAVPEPPAPPSGGGSSGSSGGGNGSAAPITSPAPAPKPLKCKKGFKKKKVKGKAKCVKAKPKKGKRR
jgi:fibronectin-binding autotransporter adhesin